MMKLVLFIVSAMVIFAADSHDFPGKPDKGDIATDQAEHSSRQLVDSDSMEERKVEKDIKLRGKGGKKVIMAIKKSLDALKDDNTKLTQADSEMKKHYGQRCKFPFIYHEKAYCACTKDGHNRLWCSTATDDKDNYNGQWKNC